MKEKSKGKLSLNKETIAQLNNEQMMNIQGGATVSKPTDKGYSDCGPCYSITNCDPKGCQNFSVAPNICGPAPIPVGHV